MVTRKEDERWRENKIKLILIHSIVLNDNLTLSTFTQKENKSGLVKLGLAIIAGILCECEYFVDS